jgi:predicted DNA-binding protein
VASPITLRLDEETRRRVARIARRKGTTTSRVLREAIVTWVAREEPPESVYESIKDLIGKVRGGDPGRSTRRLSQVLKNRRAK